MLIHHIFIPTNNSANSKLYFKLLPVLGYSLKSKTNEWFKFSSPCSPDIWLGNKPEYRNYVCFTAKNCSIVNEFYNLALSLGATCNGRPKCRSLYYDAYSAFFLDFNENCIGILHQ